MRAVHPGRRAQPRAVLFVQPVPRKAQHDRAGAQIPHRQHRLPHRRPHSPPGQRPCRELQLYGRTPRRGTARHQGKEAGDEGGEGGLQVREKRVRGVVRAHRKGYAARRGGRQDAGAARSGRDLSSAETGVQGRALRLQGCAQTQTRQRGDRRVHRTRTGKVGDAQNAGQARAGSGNHCGEQKGRGRDRRRLLRRRTARSDRLDRKTRRAQICQKAGGVD